VYVKSSRSHAERLIELNAKALVRGLPEGHNLRVDASGRIKPNTRQNQDSQAGNRYENTRPNESIEVAHLNVCGWTSENHSFFFFFQ
jgi:hypothetical protein